MMLWFAHLILSNMLNFELDNFYSVIMSYA